MRQIYSLLSHQTPAWGTAVGATVAAAGAYGLTRADTPLGIAVTIIAAVGGALAGTVVEEQKNKWQGIEYILQQNSGKEIAVVQTLTMGETIIPAGRSAIIHHGNNGFVRVVPDK